MLQAEEDRDSARRYFAAQARERELLGSESKIYNSDRYVGMEGVVTGTVADPANSFVRPTFVITPSEVTK